MNTKTMRAAYAVLNWAVAATRAAGDGLRRRGRYSAAGRVDGVRYGLARWRDGARRRAGMDVPTLMTTGPASGRNRRWILGA